MKRAPRAVLLECSAVYAIFMSKFQILHVRDMCLTLLTLSHAFRVFSTYAHLYPLFTRLHPVGCCAMHLVLLVQCPLSFPKSVFLTIHSAYVMHGDIQGRIVCVDLDYSRTLESKQRSRRQYLFEELGQFWSCMCYGRLHYALESGSDAESLVFLSSRRIGFHGCFKVIMSAYSFS